MHREQHQSEKAQSEGAVLLSLAARAEHAASGSSDNVNVLQTSEGLFLSV